MFVKRLIISSTTFAQKFHHLSGCKYIFKKYDFKRIIKTIFFLFCVIIFAKNKFMTNAIVTNLQLWKRVYITLVLFSLVLFSFYIHRLYGIQTTTSSRAVVVTWLSVRSGVPSVPLHTVYSSQFKAHVYPRTVSFLNKQTKKPSHLNNQSNKQINKKRITNLAPRTWCLRVLEDESLNLEKAKSFKF